MTQFFTDEHRALIDEIAQEFDPSKLSSVPQAPEGHGELLEAALQGERHVLRSELAMRLTEILVLPVVAEFGCWAASDYGPVGQPRKTLSIRQWLELRPELGSFDKFYDESGIIPEGSALHQWITGESGREFGVFEKEAWDNCMTAVETFERRLGALQRA